MGAVSTAAADCLRIIVFESRYPSPDQAQDRVRDHALLRCRAGQWKLRHARLAPAAGAVLLLIDLQKAIDHPSWGTRNNPTAERQIARLLAHWRGRGWPVWDVRHDSREPHSHYRPGQAGNDFKPEVGPWPGELVIAKCEPGWL